MTNTKKNYNVYYNGNFMGSAAGAERAVIIGLRVPTTAGQFDDQAWAAKIPQGEEIKTVQAYTTAGKLTKELEVGTSMFIEGLDGQGTVEIKVEAAPVKEVKAEQLDENGQPIVKEKKARKAKKEVDLPASEDTVI